MTRKVADAGDEVNNLADELCRDTNVSYAEIRHNADQTFLGVSSCLKELIDREAQNLQQSVYAALCNGAVGA